VIEEYKKAMKPLGCRLIHAMFRSLGLSEEEIKLEPIGDSNKISNLMHLNSYPACPDPNRVLGLVPHTDTDMITILHHNGVSGLQVLKRKDDIGPTRWVMVPAVPGTFVVNVGDFMHIYSNGRFHNVLHRVVVNTTYQRMSAASVFVRPIDEKVGPLCKLTGLKQDPIYRSVTWMEYLKLRDMLYDKALHAIRISEEYEAMDGGKEREDVNL
jgi:gibberellin 3beta-dioxygenase